MSTRWHKVKQPSYDKVDNILTRFVEKMKPLQEQLLQETQRLQKAVEEETRKKSEGL